MQKSISLKITKAQYKEIKRIANLKHAKLMTVTLALLKIGSMNLQKAGELDLKSDYIFRIDCEFEIMFEILNLTKKYEPINLIEAGLNDWCDEYIVTADKEKRFLVDYERQIKKLIEKDGLNKRQTWQQLKLFCGYSTFVEFCRNRKIGMVAG